jgi:hypothetical protein
LRQQDASIIEDTRARAQRQVSEEIAMDDKNDRGQADRSRINVNQAHEIKYWTQRFDVTPDQLMEAVRAVGPSVTDVESHLRQQRRAG